MTDSLTDDGDGLFDDGLWVPTASGKRMSLTRPRARDVDISDIARGLAGIRRWGGNGYSVAQHSVLASYLTPSRFALDALMHDAQEAYLTDAPRPAKEVVGRGWHELEERMIVAVSRAFGLRVPLPDEVRRADEALRRVEALRIFGLRAESWTADWPRISDEEWSALGEGAKDVGLTLVADMLREWPREFAMTTFLSRFDRLHRRQLAHRWRTTPRRGLAGAADEPPKPEGGSWQ